MNFHPVITTSVLLLILLNAIFITTPFVSSVTLIDGKIVLVMSTKQTLSAHCKSNGQDVGTFTIVPGNDASFLSHILVKQRTVASCSMTLGNLHGDFVVFDWTEIKAGVLVGCACGG
ncbi:UNVERIFIED_CONTAM: hypothetical protein Slati_2642500 [Sesamum latifolium]|uniref:S-protein homolog n=1 Tax=Sesamum latifolium TaxID=2727402 RepID=A0AAW2VYM1_9LAMI